MMLSEKVTRCDMGVGCAEAGKCYAEEQGQTDRCWHYEDTAPTRSGVVDEVGMREILAEECKAAGAWMGAADLRNNHSCDVPHNAAISAMRRVSKTDEGRNAVSDATVTAALAAFNASVNEPQMVKCARCDGTGTLGDDWCPECGGNQYNVVPGEEERAMKRALEAANLCGRNAVIEECARAIDAVTVDWEADHDFRKRDAGEYLAAHVRALTTTGGK